MLTVPNAIILNQQIENEMTKSQKIIKTSLLIDGNVLTR